MNKLITLPQLAKMTGLSREIIRACLKDGQLTSVQPRDRKFIYMEEAVRWAESKGIHIKEED